MKIHKLFHCVWFEVVGVGARPEIPITSDLLGKADGVTSMVVSYWVKERELIRTWRDPRMPPDPTVDSILDFACRENFRHFSFPFGCSHINLMIHNCTKHHRSRALLQLHNPHRHCSLPSFYLHQNHVNRWRTFPSARLDDVSHFCTIERELFVFAAALLDISLCHQFA